MKDVTAFRIAGSFKKSLPTWKLSTAVDPISAKMESMALLLADCFAAESHDCFSISAEGLTALRSLLDRPLTESGEVIFGSVAWGEVERAIVQTLAHHGH
jgi:hypothetical protein